MRAEVGSRRLACALICIAWLATHAAALNADERAGVSLPDALDVGNQQALRLNGIGVREYGIFGIDIYVAGLYLATPQRSFESIRNAARPVLILMHYVRGGGDVQDVRVFWQKYLLANCAVLKCDWPEQAVEDFLALLRPAVKNARERYEFVGGRLSYSVDGQFIGSVSDSTLCDLVMASWIGPVPSTVELRDAMLGKQ